MKISLIIPAYNEEKYIGDCLDHVISNSDGKFYEIIVINNASTDRTEEIALSKGVRVINESKKGLTIARQRGLMEAKGDYIAYIDADTKMLPHWIKVMKKTFKKNPEIVCLSGPYKYHDASHLENIIMNIFWYISAPIMYRIVGYMVLGGNFIAKKEALLSIGGFDETIDFYGEDTNIARRLSKAGKVIFDMDFFIHSSNRRLKKEGIITTNIKYAINFIWQVLFRKPFTIKSTDIRIK